MHGKVALVTGASSGIGLAVARRLVGEGAAVALVARTQKTLDDAVAQLGGSAAGFATDVTDFAALARLPERVAERFGGLDVVVNNAGVNHRGAVAERSPDALAEIITTNLTAPVFLTRSALTRLRRGGVVVNVASLAGMVPVPHEAAYCASKAGLRAFTRALAEELRDTGIGACLVSPGPVDTGFFGDVAEVPDLVFSQPMSSAEEVADAVMTCIRARKLEIAVPNLSGKLATMGYVFPSLARALRPLLERRGAANKRAYLARRRTR